MDQKLNNAFTLFLSLLVEAMPFLLLGVLFSGVLLLFIDERRLIAKLPKNPMLGALVGSFIGFLFPVCECGNVPVARRLLMQGVSAPVAIGFLLAAPTINPIVIWATWTAFRDQPEIVVLRIVFSLIIATIVGWMFSVQTNLRPLLQPAIALAIKQPEPEGRVLARRESEGSELLRSGTFLLGSQPGQMLRLDASVLQATLVATPPAQSQIKRLSLLLENTVQELRELGAVLIVGSAIAAAIQVLVPREVILNLGAGPVSSVAAMMLLSGLVSICSTVDSFFALSFASMFTSGSLLAFLVFGPMIDLKGVGLLLSIFKPRAVIYLFVVAAQLTFLLTLFINLYVS
ncbi:MAG: permease [Chroococcidiopsidaceae cyanobacterium CP_BM_ER_R8_30]|nr:permease [Chroococcidiopsidaceae cyanobacterium CP_BM_ER_R8_30]